MTRMSGYQSIHKTLQGIKNKHSNLSIIPLDMMADLDPKTATLRELLKYTEKSEEAKLLLLLYSFQKHCG